MAKTISPSNYDCHSLRCYFSSPMVCRQCEANCIAVVCHFRQRCAAELWILSLQTLLRNLNELNWLACTLRHSSRWRRDVRISNEIKEIAVEIHVWTFPANNNKRKQSKTHDVRNARRLNMYIVHTCASVLAWGHIPNIKRCTNNANQIVFKWTINIPTHTARA